MEDVSLEKALLEAMLRYQRTKGRDGGVGGSCCCWGGEVLYEEKGVGKNFGMIQVPGDSSRDLSIP